MKQIRAAVYARVSTSDQNCERQLHDLKEYCRNRGISEFAELVDQGHSGASVQRPALNQLIELARLRKVNLIVVHSLDRFSRSLKHLLNTLEELESLGVNFVSLRETIDLATPTGRLLVQVVGALAEFERGLIRERVKSGIENARRRGKRLGRPPSISQASNEAVLKMKAFGYSHRKICSELGLSMGAVTRALQNCRKIRA